MSRSDLNDWGRRLDSGKPDDPLSALAASLHVDRPPALRPSTAFKAGLRARLLARSTARTQLPGRWMTRPAFVVLLVIIAVVGIVFWMAGGPAPISPSVIRGQTTPVPSPLADLPSPTPTPERLVFNHSPQALFGPNANQSGEWRAHQNVFMANLDGTNVTALRDGPDDVNWLVTFSPNGRKVLIFSHPEWILPAGQHTLPESEQYGDLYLMDVDGSNAIKLTGGYRIVGYPTAYWLPNSDRIVFIASEDDGLGIFVINADGTGRVRLTGPEASPLYLLPSSNPERVYWRSGTIVENNYTFDGYGWTAMDGSGTQPIWENLGNVDIALSSSDGWIAYRRGDCWAGAEPACVSMFVADVDGANGIQKDWEGTPQSFYWSPDGHYLLVDVLVKTETGYGQIFYLWSPFDSSVVKLPEGIEVRSAEGWPVGPPPQWSPEGRRILFENYTWPLPKILNLDTMEVSEALTALRPQPRIIGPWGVTWLPPESDTPSPPAP